jgi:D-3-phosphoglycerate dehydrogenase / 2-oxoglutarate reductase
MAPRVLVSDKLSETAVQIFRDRGVDVDYLPDLGKDKDKLAEVIGDYDGLAIRSATKVTEKLLAAARPAQGHRPRRHRRRQRRHPGRVEARRDRDEHALRQLHHHRRARHRDDVRRGPPTARGHASTHAGKWEKNRFMGVELFNKTLGVIGAATSAASSATARWG